MNKGSQYFDTPGLAQVQVRVRIVWLVLVVAASARYVQRNVVLAVAHVGAAPSDFSHYYLAARALLQGLSPYSVYNFDYPPLVAVLALPLAPWSYVASRLAWYWLSHFFLLVAAYFVWRKSGADAVAAVSVALVWGLSGTVAENLVLGQVNPLLLLLVAVAFTAPRCGTWSLGVATALKLWPGALLLGYGVRGRWRRFLGGAGLAAVLTMGPILYLAASTPGPALPASSQFWMGTPAFLNFSFPATVLRIADPPSQGGVMPLDWKNGNDPRQLHLPTGRALLGACSGAVTFAFCLGLITLSCRNRDPDPVAIFGALITSVLAASPIAWYHYQLLQLPAVAWLGSRLARRHKAGLLVILTGTACGLTWAHRLDVVVTCTPWLILIRGVVVVALDIVLLLLLLREIRVSKPLASVSAS